MVCCFISLLSLRMGQRARSWSAKCLEVSTAALLVGLVEGLADRRCDDRMMALGHMGDRVPDPVNTGAVEEGFRS